MLCVCTWKKSVCTLEKYVMITLCAVDVRCELSTLISYAVSAKQCVMTIRIDR